MALVVEGPRSGHDAFSRHQVVSGSWVVQRSAQSVAEASDPGLMVGDELGVVVDVQPGSAPRNLRGGQRDTEALPCWLALGRFATHVIADQSRASKRRLYPASLMPIADEGQVLRVP